MAVYEAASEAVKRARAGEGPSLIECKTYRQRGHFEGDPCNYRRQEELGEWLTKDPLPRFENKLLEMKILTPEKASEIKEAIRKTIEEAIRFAQESPQPDPAEVASDVYT
jgi:TPP-dependent pyruvate/acetoin dehydrogenase alpha subunit